MAVAMVTDLVTTNKAFRSWFRPINYLSIWLDNAPNHFRTSEFLAGMKEIEVMVNRNTQQLCWTGGVSISINYFTEYHGKSICDEFFGYLARSYTESTSSPSSPDVNTTEDFIKMFNKKILEDGGIALCQNSGSFEDIGLIPLDSNSDQKSHWNVLNKEYFPHFFSKDEYLDAIAEGKTSCQIETTVSSYNFNDKYAFDVYQQKIGNYENSTPGLIVNQTASETTVLRSQKLAKCPMGALYTFNFATNEQLYRFLKVERSENSTRRKKTPQSRHDLVYGKVHQNDSNPVHLLLHKTLQVKTIKLKLGAAEPKTTKMKKVKSKLNLITARLNTFQAANNDLPTFACLI
jgi:hypothetical protein